jgi:transcriptional regulator NrdR family protein
MELADVIKRSGKKEMFNPDKMINSIKKAVIDAGMLVEEKKEMIQQVAQKVVKQVEEKGEIATHALRDNILSSLDEADPTVAQAWRRFDQKYKPEPGKMGPSGVGTRRK